MERYKRILKEQNIKNMDEPKGKGNPKYSERPCIREIINLPNKRKAILNDVKKHAFRILMMQCKFAKLIK